MSDYPGGILFAQVAEQRDLWAEVYAALWDLLGERISLTVEQRGHEYTWTGRVALYADGDYSVGQERFRPGTEGFLVRWARLGQVRKIPRAYDWAVDGECV